MKKLEKDASKTLLVRKDTLTKDKHLFVVELKQIVQVIH